MYSVPITPSVQMVHKDILKTAENGIKKPSMDLKSKHEYLGILGRGCGRKLDCHKGHYLNWGDNLAYN